MDKPLLAKMNFQRSIIDASVQLELGQMMKNYIIDSNNKNALIPANLGLSNSTIEKSIESYNKLTLLRDEELKPQQLTILRLRI